MSLLKKKVICSIITICMVIGILSSSNYASASSGVTAMLFDLNSRYSFTFNPKDVQIGYFTTGSAGSYKIAVYTDEQVFPSVTDKNTHDNMDGMLYVNPSYDITFDTDSKLSKNVWVGDLKSNRDYKIKFSGEKTCNVSVIVTRNVDRKILPNGGSWIPNKMTYDPDGFGFQVYRINYLTPEQSKVLYYSTYDSVSKKLRDGTYKLLTEAAITYALGGAPVAIKTAIEDIGKNNVVKILGMVTGSYSLFELPTLSDLERSSIKDATNNFTCGLQVTSVSSISGSTTVLQNLYNPWTAYLANKIGSGEEGYSGKFTNDITVLWN